MVKILAIDDIDDNLVTLKAIINDIFPEITVFTANNGMDGIALAIENNPDVILLDIIMPEMDGFEVCRYLKEDERVSDTPIVFLTALKDDRINRIKALEVGADGFLSKPIEETELTAQINAMVKIKAANRAKQTEKERLKKLVEEQTRELAQSESRLKGIFDNLQDAYTRTDLSGTLTMVSPSAENVYGFKPGELIGKPIEMLYAKKEDRLSLILALQAKRKVEDFVCQARKKDGTKVWVSMNVQFLIDKTGQIAGTEGVTRDITERIKAETELREKEVQFRNLANSGVALIWTSLPDKQLNFFNDSWLKFTGRTFEKEKGFGWMEGIHPNDKDICLKTYLEAFDHHESFEIECRLMHHSGKYLWIRNMGTPNYNSEGTFVGYIGHCFDITDLLQIQHDLRIAKEKAEESDRLKSAFLANMSHEIRTPLNSIIGFSELLTDPDFDKEQQGDFIQSIIENGRNLLTILSDIMDISKVESGSVTVNRHPVEVNHLISDIVREFAFKAKEKRIDFRVDTANANQQIAINSDGSKLRQILINLTSNALKFTHQGYIEIGYRLIENQIQFHVKDSGIGISKQYFEQIFERFRQIESAHTRKYGGNGLGLAISKSFVELLGGKIWVESIVNQGSTFYFTTPL